MFRTVLMSALVLLLVVGCSSPSDPVVHDTGATDQAVADVVVDTAMDTAVAADVPEPPDEVVDLQFETQPQDVGPACQPGEGCFLDPCTEHGDCLSNWCVQHLGDKVCTITCQAECPPGWNCNQVAGTEPDLVFVCVSEHANLCKPCATGADCKGVGGAEDVCVDYGDEGNFCGGSCAGDDDCPWGFSCAEAVTVTGVTSKQCVAEAGICPCTDASVELGLATPCSVTNEFGTCTGQRTCTEDGLSDCDAAIPAAETCNGLDDDCDGQVDEPNEVGGDFVNLCDDGNECSEDTCAGEAGCQSEPLDGTECKDGDICTVADHCVAGTCVGDPVICDDQNPCTDNACTENGGCEYTPNSADCDDEDPCTVADECSEGTCAGTPIACDCLADEDCQALEDGDLCNGTLFCDTESLPHLCKVDPETVVSCAEPEPGPDVICQAAACDAATGACSLVPAHEGFACDDGDPCTVGDTCQAGTCVAGGPLNCQDGNPCTDDACDSQAGGCGHQPNTAPCTDYDICTVGDICAAGECVPGTGVLSCDDGNPCTADSCDAELACIHNPAAGACEDGNPCTTGETCQAGECTGGQATVCDDENPCTLDGCDPLAGGCTYKLHDGPCNDNDVCTLNDHCHLGECIAGSEMTCDDGNTCTADSCNPLVGCVFTVVEEPCCTGGTQACGEACVDVQVDPTHCGNCETVCDPGEVCTGGECKATCGVDQELCGELCTNVLFDPANCGECGEACSGAEHASGVCISGECKAVCEGTWSDCNLDMGDGCEANLLEDVDHCGTCGEACSTVVNGTRGCGGGECEIAACVDGYKDCDTLYGTGCEANVNESTAHCGDCNQPCQAGEVCEAGECVQQPTSFIVHETKDITYQGIDYLLIKLSIGSSTATTENWCREYQTLCESFGYEPTGCGYNWPSGYYETCRSEYGSVVYDSSLSCNPSNHISIAAQQNGYGDANYKNSFGFHYCDPSSCVKVLCSGDACNSALSYIDTSKPHGYTLCIK